MNRNKRKKNNKINKAIENMGDSMNLEKARSMSNHVPMSESMKKSQKQENNDLF